MNRTESSKMLCNVNESSDSKSDSNSATAKLAPLAIVGIGCRLPGGVESWQDYWQLLEEGRDAIEETPADRWNLKKFYSQSLAPGKTQSKWGGYVRNIDLFDPQLFGISPREAASMDPQQRMLLVVAWRALEDAGQPIEKVAGEQVAVFVGISSFDYAVAGLSSADRGVIDAYSNTGGSSSIAANRISYCFDLRGPSVAVDTACSSSLVAVHMACESIWHGNSKLALAGGVNALLLPDFYVAFSQLGVLSPDGRCKTFDARANGYVRSEGAGMILIKPLADAERDGDLIYATIRSTALNQDGKTPGLTVPSQSAQESLVRTACLRAGVAPSQIQYVEAHGTGTPVGDPIEAAALASVLSEGRPKNQPCWIGSVKTNIGHLEAGAGIASLIKVALSLHHQRIPAHLHFSQANPQIDFDRLGLRVPTEMQPWHRQPQRSRLAGVNGFGYGGANAHVILEESPHDTHAVAPDLQPAPKREKASASNKYRAPELIDSGAQSINGNGNDGFELPVLLPLSARSQPALVASARKWADWLEAVGSVACDAEIAAFAAHRRSHLDYRASVTGGNRRELIEGLLNIANGESSENRLSLHENSARSDKNSHHIATTNPRIAFVCSGQGPQWWAMGRNLLRYCPVFREVVECCGKEFSKYGSWSLLDELNRSESESQMQRTHIAQPSIFAVQVGLAMVWKSWGIQPNFVIGHSVGEIAAAYISGALTFEDACAVAFHRGRTMDLATSQGAMLAAGLSASEAHQWIDEYAGNVSIAAINGPTSITLSGNATAIDQLSRKLEAVGVFCRRLKVEYAFHSAQMDPVREELLRSLEHLKPQTTHTQLISTVTGKPVEGHELSADYWWQNVRQSVLFANAMQELAQQDCHVALELGPHPVLAFSITECFQAANKQLTTIPSLHRDEDDLRCMVNSLGELYRLGANILWKGFYTRPSRKLLVPDYPFQRVRCWSESLQTKLARLGAADHPLLGESQHGPQPHWQSRIDLRLQSFLADHRVRGACVLPAAAIIESLLAAARIVNDSQTIQLDRLQLHNPCLLAEGRAQWIETVFHSDRRLLEVQFRDADDDHWSKLASTNVSTLATSDINDLVNAKQNLQAGVQTFGASRLYDYCQRLGLEYGTVFRGIQSGTRTDGFATARVQVELEDDSGLSSYIIHPALLDACFHAMIAADFEFDHTLGGLYLPAEIRRIQLFKSVQKTATVHVRLTSKTEQRMLADIDILDDQGRLCVSIRGFESHRVQGGGKPAETTADLAYRYTWIEQPLATDPVENSHRSVANWLIFTENETHRDPSALGAQLTQQLRAQGNTVTKVVAGQTYAEHESYVTIDPANKSHFDRLLNSRSDQEQPITHVIYLWGLNSPGNASLNTESLDASTRFTTLAPLYLVQAFESHAGPPVHLTIVTCTTQSTERTIEPVSVAQSPLIGFGRVIASESSRFNTRLVDIDSVADAHSLLQEVLSKPTSHSAKLTNDPLNIDERQQSTVGEEDEVMWRGGSRYVHRFTKADELPLPPDTTIASRLNVGDSAAVESLKYCSLPPISLGPHDVEIEIIASGLNFSDVMKVLGLYPGLPDGFIYLGAECSGRIIRVGSRVTNWNVGDEIMAIAPGSFATRTTVSENLIARKPRNLTFEQAAAIPIAFLTADYALNECARIRSGESVLIHAASGGVGLAAIQLAKIVGATIFATAGNKEKRDFVEQLNVRQVMDSRSLAFADEVLAATANDELPGVDVVLNSLPGEAISKGIGILKTGGRFLEIGKRDIYDDVPLGLFPFRNNLAFFAIDLDQLFKQIPQQMGQRLAALVERFESGELQPLPITTFPSDATRAAFKFMQQGKHIGKVVISFQQLPSEVYPGPITPIQFRSDATYWIAGGLGGFGKQVARWLASRGAGQIVLSGRREPDETQEQALRQEFAALGAQVTLLPTDITDANSVARSLQIIQQSLPPLAGVFHTAMVLEDRLLVDLDRETLEKVLAPKVLGGWNLHQQTAHLKLDHFVLFSSLSSVFGHAGQANYSAANALLDGLAHYRRALGLPALVMNWGHLGEVGYLAEREQLGQRLERQGVLSFTVQQALAALEYAMQLGELQLSVLRIDWSVWRGLGITNRVSPRFAHLIRNQTTESNTFGGLASAAQLRSATPELRHQMVEQLLRHKSGSLLGIAGEEIQRERALLEMGLDSLMAVELRNWIESHLEISLPISSLMRSSSFTEVVSIICDIVDSTAPSASREQPVHSKASNASEDSDEITERQASELLEQLPSLNDQEVSQLLARMLRNNEN